MAERRMFAKTIIDSDAFLDMPLSTQALYFHLSMRADDDGFINNPRKILRMVGACDDDLKVLIAKKFIIPFDSGIVVIKHWKIHNYIRNDRYKETVYQQERALLAEKENKAYTLAPPCDTAGIPDGIPSGYQMETQVRLGKDRLDQDRIGEVREGAVDTTAPTAYGEYANVFLTAEDLDKLQDKLQDKLPDYIDRLSRYMEKTGKTYKNHRATIEDWAEKDKREQKQTTSQRKETPCQNPFLRMAQQGVIE